MPGGDRPTIELSSPPEGRDEQETELRDIAELGAANTAPMRAAVASVAAAAADLSATTFRSPAFEAASSPPANIPNEAISDPTPNDGLRRIVSAIERNTRTQHADSEKGWNADRWMALIGLGSGLIASAAAIYALVHQSASGGGTADIPVPQEASENAAALARAWRDQPAQTYFDTLAQYITTSPSALTLGDQQLFMSFTALLAPTPFVWDSETDKMTKVTAGLALYNANANSLSEMYRQATRSDTMKYKTAFLPKATLASVLQLTLQLIFIESASVPDGG